MLCVPQTNQSCRLANWSWFPPGVPNHPGSTPSRLLFYSRSPTPIFTLKQHLPNFALLYVLGCAVPSSAFLPWFLHLFVYCCAAVSTNGSNTVPDTYKFWSPAQQGREPSVHSGLFLSFSRPHPSPVIIHIHHRITGKLSTTKAMECNALSTTAVANEHSPAINDSKYNGSIAHNMQHHTDMIEK